MPDESRRSWIFRQDAPTPCLPRSGPSRRPRTAGTDPLAGQAYTEYLIVLFFGVFLCLGIVIMDHSLDLHIMERLYGYIFDYYAGIANFLSLPTF